MKAELQTELKTLIAETLECDASTLSSDEDIFYQCQIDSLDALELLVAVEEHFHVYFTEESLSDLRTLNQIQQAIENLTLEKAS